MYTAKEGFADFHYLMDCTEELYKQYGTQYVVIKNQELLGVFKTKELADEFINEVGITGECIVHILYTLSNIAM